MRLLFVEDEPDLREVLKKQLQGSGYSVDACGDGLEALDYLQLTAYDAVIFRYYAARSRWAVGTEKKCVLPAIKRRYCC